MLLLYNFILHPKYLIVILANGYKEIDLDRRWRVCVYKVDFRIEWKWENSVKITNGDYNKIGFFNHMYW